MTISLDICICTFKRPDQLAEALNSLMALRWPKGVTGRVLVIDNDDTPSAKEVFERCASQLEIKAQYIHAPGRNISIARNAALAESDAELLAFLDDDERACPGWIDALYSQMRDTYAEAVLGPVEAIYPPTAPSWMRKARPHDTKPVFVNDTIKTGYTCNVLIDCRSPRITGKTFDLAFGRSGGEDTAFFRSVVQSGGHIAYAPDALVVEDVPEKRARLRWLLWRRYRMGQTHGQLVVKGLGFFSRLKASVTAGAKAIYSAATVLLHAFDASRRNIALMRTCLHIGAVAGILGSNPIVLYGIADKPEKKRAA